LKLDLTWRVNPGPESSEKKGKEKPSVTRLTRQDPVAKLLIFFFY
jgi:hypothetical protein